MSDVQIREVPEMIVVTEQRTVDQPALEKWLPEAMARVGERAGGSAGVAGTDVWTFLDRADRPNEPVFIVIYEGNPNEGPVSVETCAPLHPGAALAADAASRRIPAHREAYVRVTKETVTSGGLGQVYPEIEAWINENGLEISAAPRETYWTGFYEAEPSDEVFDVAFPVR